MQRWLAEHNDMVDGEIHIPTEDEMFMWNDELIQTKAAIELLRLDPPPPELLNVVEKCISASTMDAYAHLLQIQYMVSVMQHQLDQTKEMHERIRALGVIEQQRSKLKCVKESIMTSLKSGQFEETQAVEARYGDVLRIAVNDQVEMQGLRKKKRQRTNSGVKNFCIFNSKTKSDLGLLSNFANVPVMFDGFEYPTGEHCFHAQKFMHAASKCTCTKRAELLENHVAQFKKKTLAVEAKKAGGTKGLRLTKEELEAWDYGAEEVQLQICKSKLAAVKECLLNTHDAFLVHQDNRATISTLWGGKVEAGAKNRPITTEDIVGKNKLGFIWMQLRNEIRA